MSQASPDPRDPGASHIAALDGLRGVAAFAVLAHHVGLVRNQAGLFSHAYLAVDFFFLLSGFVMGLAYERRMSEGLTFFSFMRLRLARLYPMIFIGAVMGCAVALIQKQDFVLGLALAAQLVFIPFVISQDSAYPLDNVQWSLFFEIFVNVLHSLLRSLLSTTVMAIIAAISAVALVFADIYFGSLSVGYNWTNFIGGFPRVVFSYSAGILTYRILRGDRFNILGVPYIVVVLLLIIILGVPAIRFLRDSVIVIIFFPALLVFSLRSSAGPRIAQVATWGGAISYPLYMIHVPILQVAVFLLPRNANSEVHAFFWCLTIAFVVAFAWGLEHVYDAPIRRWLGRRRRARRERGNACASS